MAHVADYKKKNVQEFVELINSYPIVGAVDLENMPAAQLQTMRSLLRETVVLKMSKRRLMSIALDQSKDKKKGIEKLNEHLRGMPALLFTKENPFKLFKKIQANKSKAPAKAGQTAPNDIVVTAGPTSFAPGPIISELGSLGLKTSVENGKIAIKEDAVVVKYGEVIKAKTAELLTRLGIEPMEIGLNLIATYEDGTIYTKDILSIDEVKFMQDITNAAQWAFNLSVESAYPVKENIDTLIGKAFNDSKGLALEANILADAVMSELIGKAERSMLSLKNIAKIQVGEKKAKVKVAEKESAIEQAEKVEQAAEVIEKNAEDVKEEISRKVEVVKEKADQAEKKDPELKETVKDVKKEADNVEKIVESKVEEVMEKAEEIIENVQDIKKDAEAGKDVTENLKAIERVEEKLEVDVEKLKQDVKNIENTTEAIVDKEEPTVELVERVKEDAQKLEDAVEKLPAEDKREVQNIISAPLEEEKSIENEQRQSERLFEELKKKGTLRDSDASRELMGVQGKTLKESGNKREDVPSAHELAAKLKRNTKKS